MARLVKGEVVVVPFPFSNLTQAKRLSGSDFRSSEMNKAHEVSAISFQGTVLQLRVDGKDYRVDVAQHSARLASATPEQRANYEISPAGYGVHWPELDEDLSIDRLIGVSHAYPLTERTA